MELGDNKSSAGVGLILLLVVWVVGSFLLEDPLELKINTEYCVAGCLIGGVAEITLTSNAEISTMKEVRLVSKSFENKEINVSSLDTPISIRLNDEIEEGAYPISVYAEYDKGLYSFSFFNLLGSLFNTPKETKNLNVVYPKIATMLNDKEENMEESKFTINVNNESNEGFYCKLVLVADKAVIIEHPLLECDEGSKTRVFCESDFSDLNVGSVHPCCADIKAISISETTTRFEFYPICIIDDEEVKILKRGQSLNEFSWNHEVRPLFG